MQVTIHRECSAGRFQAVLLRSNSLRVGKLWPAIIALVAFVNPGFAADACTQSSAPIETDRPDVTNSSVVVPVGSLQNENGINVSRRDGATIFDGTNSRLRLGIAPCFEILIDLPNYVGTF